MGIGACEEKCEPIPKQERIEAEWRERERERRLRLESQMFEEPREPKEKERGINRYILCDGGKEGNVCMSCMRASVCVCVFVCVCLPGLSVQGFI